MTVHQVTKNKYSKFSTSITGRNVSTGLLKTGLTAMLAMTVCISGCDKTAADTPGSKNIGLLNVSYDVSRDFYKGYNPEFIKSYQAAHPGSQIKIDQSHGGSSKQALSVANGLQADVVTMNQQTDIDILVDKGLVSKDWQQKFPNNAVPYTSTMVFLVRTGNPKHIKDWSDLAQQGVEVVMPNPKTSGTARYAFLGAYGFGLHTFNQDKTKTDTYIRQLLANVVTYDNGSRAATTTFSQRGMGDVLITTENEAQQVAQQFAKGKVEVIYPSYSIRIDNPVAEVTAVTAKKGTSEAAQAYLQSLWEVSTQEQMAKLYLRPSNPEVLAAHAQQLPKIATFDPTEVFGPWSQIMETFFGEGGQFDQLAKSDSLAK
ncbi:sulfate ABC transporter substrate-binding protein [Psychrobacter arenosus]|uniref:sulfate ABC transporter substrate-binding protein n=1 Tax=Psychrobacter arenosus TaxID=256326 RepID=UPI001918FDFA|nr:sulfate ABC transporter substrate-binding protein [Psychrobacter arenosus]